MSREHNVSEKRLLEVDARLAGLHHLWVEWEGEHHEVQRQLEAAGMDRLEAATAMHRRQVDAFRDGTAPLSLDEVNEVLDELCSLYPDADHAQRLRIRGFFEDKDRLRKYLHSYVGGRAAALLRSTGERKWLRLGLAAASIADQKVDYRDLLICLGKLWSAAEEAGIAPARFFSAVGRISSDEPAYGNRSTRELLRGFRTSAYLKSIKRGREGS
jgi:hypothetical protein